MTEEQIEKETESYGADLCAYCRECEGENPCQHKKDAMHGYKDGLKAGYHECQKEHEWHDLKKDPTDEPKKDGEYLVQVMCIMFNDVEYCVGRYWKEENRWEGEQVRGLLVTKWKEIE